MFSIITRKNGFTTKPLRRRTNCHYVILRHFLRTYTKLRFAFLKWVFQLQLVCLKGKEACPTKFASILQLHLRILRCLWSIPSVHFYFPQLATALVFWFFLSDDNCFVHTGPFNALSECRPKISLDRGMPRVCRMMADVEISVKVSTLILDDIRRNLKEETVTLIECI